MNLTPRNMNKRIGNRRENVHAFSTDAGTSCRLLLPFDASSVFSLEAGTRVLEAARLDNSRSFGRAARSLLSLPSPTEMAHELVEFFDGRLRGGSMASMVAVCAKLCRRVGYDQPSTFLVSVTRHGGPRFLPHGCGKQSYELV